MRLMTKRPNACFVSLSFAGLVVLARSLNPIPSRTRPLNSSAPMVLWLKPWESRSLPGLPRTKQFLFTCHDQTKRRFPSGRRRFCFWASCYFLRGAPNEGTMSQKTRDLLALSDLNVSEIMTIVERAQDMAAFWNQRRMVQSLAGYRFALV